MNNGFSDEMIQTLVLLWVFTWLAMFLMVTRLIMRKVRCQHFDISDKITLTCMVCLMARLAFIHVVLLWGGNNLPRLFRLHHRFSKTEIYQREIGSKLTIISRTFYNTYLWLQKAVVLILCQRILGVVQYIDIITKTYWAILVATYIVIQVATFTDCRPIYLYWQVVPDPGRCSEAVGQLIILGALNIFTDILLIVLPIPTLLTIRSSLGSKLRLLGLFSLGIFLVAITVIRLPFNVHNADTQVNRTTWASAEAFTAAFVANVPTLFTLRKPLREKSTAIERLSGVGWMEADKSSTAEEEPRQELGDDDRGHILAKKSVELQNRRKGLLIPPKDNELPEFWDRKSMIRHGKVEYMGKGGERERERVSMDSFMIFEPKE